CRRLSVLTGFCRIELWRYITEGINAINSKALGQHARDLKIALLFERVDPSMPSTEIESAIEDILED
ncbi:MAG: hypothetical protein WCQ50_18205, partial [Spirochaetota bacterium]